MKFRYLTFLLLLVFVVGIGAISAEDISDIGEISSEEVTDEVISAEDSVTGVSTSDADEVVSDGESTRSSTYTWGDFKSEVEDTSVNTVKLNQSNIAPSSDSSDQISINHDITIVGGYGYYIGNADWNSAESYNYIPMITSGNNLNVNFENVTFQYLSNNIFIKLMGNGNFAFKNCVFNNINCTGDHQSVIWLNYGYALIENCTFTNVKSSFGAVTNYYTSWGTAVNNARMTVKNSTFKDNNATTEPGAINNCGKLEVYDSTFENNEAFWWAGAIHTHSNANTTIVRSNFKNNVAGWNGGALYSYSYLTVINSTFIANEAHLTSGGAIAASSYGSSPVVVVENCDFDDNLAYGSGGAISFSGTSLTVNDSRFNDNAARDGAGGAISSGGTTANINNCNFTNNSASGRGGAVYASGAGYLNVYYSNFVNNTGSEGNDIAYYYTTKKNNAAFLNYDYNQFRGVNNASSSIYAYNTQYLVVNAGNHNQFYDIDENVTPIEENSTTGDNDTNSSTNFISIPDGTTIGTQLWNASLDGALGGTPLINGDYIYVPNGHNVYCYNINTGALLWNVSSQWGYFHELALHNNVIIAPCAWDKLYFIDATTGALIQNESNIYPGSSIYAPLVVDNTIYISSEYGYNDAWIAVIEYVNGEYVYTGSILEISNVPYGEQGLLSQPVADSNGNIWVNTVDGLVRIDPYTYDYDVILNGTYGKPVVYYDVIYTLAYDNRIYRIMDNYIDYSDVVTGGLGNSLVFSDYYYVLFFVTDDGVLNVFGNDLYPYGSYQLNPTSSNIASIDGVLYIGDDAGILWAIDASLQDNPILWAYDTGLGILGTPVIADDVVYVGNNETFYALSGVVSGNLNVNDINNRLKSLNSLKNSKNSDILSFTNDEFLTDSFNHVYVSVDGTGDGSSADNPTSLTNAITANIADNTIVHIADGNYEVTSPVTIKAKENITIMADNPGKVNISYKNTNKKVYLTLQGINNFTVSGINFNYTYSLMTFIAANVGTGSNMKMVYPTNIVIDYCNFDGNGISTNAIYNTINPSRNLTISNCNFSNSNARFLSINTNLVDYTQKMVGYVSGECVVNITNCIFTNCSTDAVYLADIKDKDTSPNSIIKHYITNCKFYNTSLTIGVGNQVNTESIYEIKDCIFDIDEGPSIKNTGQSNTFGGIFTFENNNINSDYAIQLGDNSRIISPLTFRILNNESIKVSVNESVDLIGELVDDKGNRIYHAGLKLDVNGSEMSPVINQNGLYVLSFTPENIGELPIEVKCSPIDVLDADIFTLIVSGNPNLTVKCNDSVYGDPFNVNVTLNDAVSGENVTFSIVDSNGNVIKSTNSKIDNAFASASFEYLPAGDYTVKVTYDGDDNFGTSSVSRAFSISKANSTLNLNVDLIIAASDNFTVEAIVPGVGGIVTFRINNTEYTKTESVSDGVAVAIFDALSVGEYTVIASWAGDDNYNPSEEYNITFNVVKTDVDLNISADDVDWGNDVNVIVKTNSKFTGNITVKLGDVEKVVEIKDGSGQVSFADLKADTYNVTAKFNETELFLSSQKDINVTVNKVNSTLTVGDEITFDWDKSGSTTVSYTGATDISASVDGGVVSVDGNTITVSGLAAGNYTLSVSTVADENHTSITKTVNVRVNKVNSTLTLGDDIVFDWNESGSTTVSYDGATSVEASVDGGVVSVDGNIITVSGLSAGNHTLSVSTVADENHTSITKTVNVKVNKVNATVNLNDIAFDYGSFNSTTFDGEGIKNVTATILNQPGAKIAVSANTITVSGLDAGNYTLEVIVVPDENHNAVTKTVNVTVNKVDSVAEIMNKVVFDYGGIGQCSVFTDGANNFTAVVDGHSEAKITIENGIVNVSGLNAGIYTLKVTTNPDNNHKSVTQTVNVTVNKVDSKLTIPDITFTYSESATVSAVIGNASGIADVSVVGHPEAKVTVNGTNITVSGLNAGTYTLTATTVGDVNYNPVSANATVTVKGVDVPASQALSTNVPANSQSPTFSIKLDKDATGNFTVSVDGKVVDTKPLKDGSASITVANLAAGNHKISISYSGDGKYAPITQNTTLTIKAPAVVKKATKIVAKKKTFKAKVKVKKYTITLKSGKTLLKKVKVTLKVKGKTYKATTNNKGKATFKIKNLKKKGTYNAVIKFKGNKNYKASSKKVKIKVKK